MTNASERLKVKPYDLLGQIDRLQDQIKQKEKQAQALEEKLALLQADSLLNSATQAGGIKVISGIVNGVSADGLKVLTEHLRERGDNVAIVLGTVLAPDKVSITAALSDSLVKQGLNAGNLVKAAAAVCGGGGGGRPNMAQAGGKDASKLSAALEQAVEQIRQSAAAKA